MFHHCILETELHSRAPRFQVLKKHILPWAGQHRTGLGSLLPWRNRAWGGESTAGNRGTLLRAGSERGGAPARESASRSIPV